MVSRSLRESPSPSVFESLIGILTVFIFMVGALAFSRAGVYQTISPVFSNITGDTTVNLQLTSSPPFPKARRRCQSIHRDQVASLTTDKVSPICHVSRIVRDLSVRCRLAY